MALKSPLMPSPSSMLSSAFSPYSDSPNSPAPNGIFNVAEKRSSAPSDSLAPPPSPYPQHVDPSPVDSNGTENTDIEEEAQEDAGLKPREESEDDLSPDIEIRSPQSAESDRMPQLDTRLPVRRPSEDEPQSVIHAPSDYKSFESSKPSQKSPTEGSENTVVSPPSPEAAFSPTDKAKFPMSPVNTDVPRYNDRSTPRAHTKQEFDGGRSMHTPSLEDIPESQDVNNDDQDRPSTASLVTEENTSKTVEESLMTAEEEVANLGTALSECWTLCNTLASLSSTQRQRTFKFSGKQHVQEQAWRSCWRMCQQLYDSKDEDHASQVLPTLELCRDFCQCLFEARQRTDEASDSVLRVSFELNNHLYNTHDRQLPEAFSERTLDFYITLCHRLMKQRTSLPQETDALLRACWNLAEMLFNLRQSTKEGKRPDEELLGSAIQACWELCDLFREGWTQIRPDRGTPRPSQTSFPSQASLQTSSSRSAAHSHSNSTSGNRQYDGVRSPRALPPETPSTIFDDASTATSSPDGGSVPNILVLGPASTGNTSNSNSLRAGGTHHDRWSSNASALSDYSESDRGSQRTSSTATANSDEAQLVRLRCLLLKAGMNTGFSRISGQRLPVYVQSLPKTAFGALPWQEKVFGYYKNLVLGDKSLETVHAIPSRRLGANEVAKAVRWLGSDEKWAWVRDLYRIVFGFGIDEAERRGGSFQQEMEKDGRIHEMRPTIFTGTALLPSVSSFTATLSIVETGLQRYGSRERLEDSYERLMSYPRAATEHHAKESDLRRRNGSPLTANEAH